jgi:predicted cobalt transporter CbtA
MSPDLKRVSRRIWWLIGGGAVWFIACTLVLAATHPDTPANELVNRRTMWLFIPSVILVTTGVYVSLRYWRCPYCGHPLTTRFPIPEACPRCGRDLGG